MAELKTGCYEVEGKALGQLTRKGAGAKEEWKFWVATVHRGAQKEMPFWESLLKPKGKEKGTGNPRFKIQGHPLGGFFVQLDESTFSERSSDNTERFVWRFREDIKGKFLTTVASPPVSAKDFPTANFAASVLEKQDPARNDPGSPPTDIIIEACCGEEEKLPSEVMERQKALARCYTLETPLYHEMNTALRNDDLSAMKYYSAYIKELRDVFKTDHEDQIIEPFEGKVWRGITFDDPEKALGDFQVGSKFVWSAFTSMTTDREVAFGFGNVVFEVVCLPPKEAYEGAVAVYAPASVSAFSDFGEEAEILFPPNIQFEVKEVRRPDDEDESPLVICETVAFDSDEGLKEFQDFKKMLDTKLNDGSQDDTEGEARLEVIKAGYKRLFEAIDANKSGGISKKEMKAALTKISGAVAFAGAAFPGLSLPGEGGKARKSYVNKLFQHADVSGDGTLDLVEFSSFLLANVGEAYIHLPAAQWTEVKKTLEAVATAFEEEDFSGLGK